MEIGQNCLRRPCQSSLGIDCQHKRKTGGPLLWVEPLIVEHQEDEIVNEQLEISDGRTESDTCEGSIHLPNLDSTNMERRVGSAVFLTLIMLLSGSWK